MSWSSAVVRLESMWSKLGVYVIDQRYMLPETEPSVLRVVAWSLNVLAGGVWPAVDHCGRAWPPQSDRERRVGQPLTTTGHSAVFVELGGDWKFL
eukprot:11743350-Alexandrium_andersonii.AAC.1